MRNITLADLLACDEGGMMLVAEHCDTGQAIHIRSVPRGLICNCICPSCHRALIARKGTRRHSFAHRPDEVQRSCVAAGETLLHAYAKELLGRFQYVFLPAQVVADELGVLELRPAGKVVFDRVELEVRQGDVVPDVVCYVGNHRLYVEFKVTHAVDDQKRLKLKRHDVSVVEIDLSSFRHLDVEALEQAILVEAPRKMLQSKLVDQKGAMRLTDRRRRMDAELASKAGPLVRLFRQERMPPDLSGEQWRIDVEALWGMSDPTPGEVVKGPLTIRRDDWENWIGWQILTGPDGWTVRRLAYVMTGFGWVKPGLYEIEPHLANHIRDKVEPDFVSAVGCVQSFLDFMQEEGLVYKRMKDRYFASGSYKHALIKRRRELDLIDERREELAHMVEPIIKVLDVAIARAFSFDEWFAEYCRMSGVEERQVLDEAFRFDALRSKIDAVKVNMAGGRPDTTADLVGLPVFDYIAERVIRREKFRREQAARQEQQAREAGAARRLRLEERAMLYWYLPGQAWLKNQVEFEGFTLTSGEHAARSPVAAAEMNRLLDLRVRQYEDEQRFEVLKSDVQAALLKAATDGYGNVERGSLWVNSHSRELGMRRPIDVCVDETTLAQCIVLLPEPRRKT